MPLNTTTNGHLPSLRSTFLNQGDGGSPLSNCLNQSRQQQHRNGGGGLLNASISNRSFLMESNGNHHHHSYHPNGNSTMNDSTVGEEVKAHIASVDDRLAHLETMLTRMNFGDGGQTKGGEELTEQLKQLREEIVAKPKPSSSSEEHSQSMRMLEDHNTTLKQQLAAKDEQLRDMAREKRELVDKLTDLSVRVADTTSGPSSRVSTAPQPSPAAQQADSLAVMQQYAQLQQLMWMSQMQQQPHQQQQQLPQMPQLQPVAPPANSFQPTSAAMGGGSPMMALMNQFGPTATQQQQPQMQLPQMPQQLPPIRQPAPVSQQSLFATPPAAPTLAPMAHATPPPSFAAATPPTTTVVAPAEPKPFLFAGFRGLTSNATPPATSPAQPAAPTRDRTLSEHGADDYEPTVDFVPVCALPDVVDTLTGEEDERVLFVARAKLFRFTDGEFKERGVGDLKILRNEQTKRTRCVMRRDVVLKVCANFGLRVHMTLKAHAQSDKAFVWSCVDFADDVECAETMSARFKTADIARQFKAAFEDACRTAGSGGSGGDDGNDGGGTGRGANRSAGKGATGGPGGSAAGPPKAPPVTGQPFGAQFLPAAGTYECTLCSLRVDAGAVCAVCNVDKDGNKAAAPAATKPGAFTFGLKTTPAATTTTATTTAATTTFGGGGGFKFGAAKESPFSVKKADATPAVKPDVTKADEKKAVNPFAGFAFASPPKPTPTTEATTAATTTSATTTTTPTSAAPAAKPFGIASPATTTNAFGTLASNSGEQWAGFGAGFQAVTPKPMFGGSPAAAAGTDADPEDYEVEVDFQPVCPLPDLVDVKTGEEDEIKLFGARAKLYRFAEGEFKERGVGELKLLRDPATMKTRCVMRRDVVHKVCANFVLQSKIEIRPMAQSERAWTWTCMDYADEELTHATLAARFKTTDIANEFKTVFETACRETATNATTTTTTTPAAAPTPTTTPSSTTTAGGFGDAFKPAAGSWECAQCLLRVDKGDLCKVCNVDVDGKKATSAVAPKASAFSFGLPPPAAATTTSAAATTATVAPISFSFKSPTSAAAAPSERTASDPDTVLPGVFTRQENQEAATLVMLAKRALVQDDTAAEYDTGADDDDYEDCDEPVFACDAQATVSKQGHTLQAPVRALVQVFEDDDVDAYRVHVYECDAAGDMADTTALVNHVIVGDLKWTPSTRVKSPFTFTWDANDYGSLGQSGQLITVKLQFNNAAARDAFTDRMTEVSAAAAQPNRIHCYAQYRDYANTNGVVSLGGTAAPSASMARTE